MNKKVIIGIVIVVLCIIIAAGSYFINNNPQENENQIANSNEENAIGTNETQAEEETNTAEGENTETQTGGKTLVVYYSAQNHTEAVAEKIAQNLGADIFEIVPTDEYTSEDLNWNDQNSRVTREYEDESLRDIELESTSVDNWDDYDTVLYIIFIKFRTKWRIIS